MEQKTEKRYTLRKTRTYNFNVVDITVENVLEAECAAESEKLDKVMAVELKKLKELAPTPKTTNWNNNNGGAKKAFTIKNPTAPASDAQLGMINKMGGSTVANMTKQQASDEIGRLKDGNDQKNRNQDLAATSTDGWVGKQ